MLTADDHDYCWTVNYLGHFLFTRLLLADRNTDMRIINVNSDAYSMNPMSKSSNITWWKARVYACRDRD